MAEPHTHKYGIVRVGKAKQSLVFRCADSKCSHYLPNHLLELAIGKASICWSCSKEFIIKRYHLKRKPICEICKAKKGKVEEVIQPDLSSNIMKSLGIDIDGKGEEDGEI